MRTITRKAALGGIAALGVVGLLAACAEAPDAPANSNGGDGAAADFLPCMVSDEGGFDDRSFNQSSYEGLVKGAEEAGVEYQVAESNAETEYAGNIEALIGQGCSLIFSVGFKLTEATAAAAEANPDVHFVMIDDTIEAENVRSILFDTSQAAFLAGYAAAATTETGKVATWGGVQLPTVTIFMEGFEAGVEYYNEQKGASVQVLGWSTESGSGSFTGAFAADPAAKAMAAEFIGQGADVLFPVGGPIYISAAEAVRDAQRDNAGERIAIVGVDADLYEADSQFGDLFLTSVLKDLGAVVAEAVAASADGSFTNEPFLGTLENNGVGVAPFHDYEEIVDADLQSELDTIRAAIIAGDIEVGAPSAP